METTKPNKTAGTPDPMLVRPFVIRRVIKETADTFSLELTPQNGSREFVFAPGQFNMLYVFGVGEVPISISGDPAKSGRLVHTTRAVGTVTKAMSGLKVGDIIGVRGPYGASWPVAEAEDSDVIIVAGGIGLAPLRPVIYHLSNIAKNSAGLSFCMGRGRRRRCSLPKNSKNGAPDSIWIYTSRSTGQPAIGKAMSVSSPSLSVIRRSTGRIVWRWSAVRKL